MSGLLFNQAVVPCDFLLLEPAILCVIGILLWIMLKQPVTDEGKAVPLPAKQVASDSGAWPRYLVGNMRRLRERFVQELGHIRWVDSGKESSRVVKVSLSDPSDWKQLIDSHSQKWIVIFSVNNLQFNDKPSLWRCIYDF